MYGVQNDRGGTADEYEGRSHHQEAAAIPRRRGRKAWMYEDQHVLAPGRKIPQPEDERTPG